MTRLPYADRTLVRILSARTGETLFEIKMLSGSMSATLREPSGFISQPRGDPTCRSF